MYSIRQFLPITVKHKHCNNIQLSLNTNDKIQMEAADSY